MHHDRVRSVAAAVRRIARAPESREELSFLASTLAYWQTRTMALLLLPAAAVPEDRMLTAAQAARTFSLSKSFLYERGEELGFARRPPGLHGVRFSEKGLREWMDGQR